MKVMVRDDNRVVLDDLPESRVFVFSPPDAVAFARSVIDAAARCGYQIVVEARMRDPTPAQVARAITRVGHIRRAAEHSKPWHDFATNCDIVNRVLETLR